MPAKNAVPPADFHHENGVSPRPGDFAPEALLEPYVASLVGGAYDELLGHARDRLQSSRLGASGRDFDQCETLKKLLLEHLTRIDGRLPASRMEPIGQLENTQVARLLRVEHDGSSPLPNPDEAQLMEPVNRLTGHDSRSLEALGKHALGGHGAARDELARQDCDGELVEHVVSRVNPSDRLESVDTRGNGGHALVVTW